MDDQEAQSIIDSQPGATLIQRELNATNQLVREMHTADIIWYQTLTKITEHYSDTARHRRENITVDNFNEALRYADPEEAREARRLLNADNERTILTANRVQALIRYIQHQNANVQA